MFLGRLTRKACDGLSVIVLLPTGLFRHGRQRASSGRRAGLLHIACCQQKLPLLSLAQIAQHGTGASVRLCQRPLVPSFLRLCHRFACANLPPVLEKTYLCPVKNIRILWN